MAICMYQRVHLVLFKGQFAPGGLDMANYCPDNDWYCKDCRGSTVEINSFIDAVEDFARGYLKDFLIGFPVPIDTTNNSRCQIEIIN
jgi:hypothetical protein